MAEKLATRVVSSPTELFALADKCARAAEARERQSGRLDAKEPKPSDPQEGPSSGGKKKKRKGTADLAFQDADQTIACLHGGASTCSSRQGLKLFRREVCAATPALEACQPLKWSEVPITFSRVDLPESTKGVGRLPIVVTPTIRNVKVGRVLIDGVGGLNMLNP